MIMRTLFVTLFMMASVLGVQAKAISGTSSHTTFDNEPKVQLISSKDGKKVRLIFSGSKAEDVLIRVYDEARRNLYADWIRGKQEFSLPMDLSKLEAGDYTVKLFGDGWELEREISVRPLSVAFDAEVFPSPNDKRFMLSVRQPNVSTVRVVVVDPFNKTLMDDQVNLNEDGTRYFNMEKVPSRSATVYIMHGNQVIERQLNLN